MLIADNTNLKEEFILKRFYETFKLEKIFI